MILENIRIVFASADQERCDPDSRIMSRFSSYVFSNRINLVVFHS